MKKLVTSHIFMIVVLVGCLWLSFIPTAHDFAVLRHHLDLWGVRRLINSVHDEHWDIAYTFDEDCPPERRAEAKKIEDAITLALQTWLQPLREIETEAPIVNEFRFQQLHELPPELAHLDLVVVDTCKRGRSAAGGSPIDPPIVVMRVVDINNIYMTTLVHEIGHTIGLGDTYVDRPMKPSVTKGGLDATVGTQPASAMSVHLHNHTGHYISEDDINGIIWLYKATYEDLDPANCLYPNYVLEKDPLGCVPKHPLIFEIRQGYETYALDILRDDENIDVNVQNGIGLSALHYAVMDRSTRVFEALLEHPGLNVNLPDAHGQTALHYAISKGYTSVVNRLLEHDDILVHVKDNAGRTPVSLARETGNTDLAKRLLAHPNYSLHVAPKQKLVTTWANLKQRD